MIQHIVLIRFQADVTEDQAAALLVPLGPIARRLGFAASWGRSESPERIERGYLHGFVASFADWAALETYQADPDHKAFGAGLVAHAQGGIDGILVFDLAPSPSASVT